MQIIPLRAEVLELETKNERSEFGSVAILFDGSFLAVVRAPFEMPSR